MEAPVIVASSGDIAPCSLDSKSLKLPPFNSDGPDAWFSYIESSFGIKNVTDDRTMFNHVVCSLDKDISKRILDTIKAQPSTSKYEAIKARLLKEFGLTDDERDAKLLDYGGLGDVRPSQLLTQMILLLLPKAERGQAKCLFREVFLRQLPSDVRKHLADKKNLLLTEFAEEADNSTHQPASRYHRWRSSPRLTRAHTPRR